MSTVPEVGVVDLGSDEESQEPTYFHFVLEQLLEFPAYPALCGVILTADDEGWMVQAIAEGAADCQACVTIMLELHLAQS